MVVHRVPDSGTQPSIPHPNTASHISPAQNANSEASSAEPRTRIVTIYEGQTKQAADLGSAGRMTLQAMEHAAKLSHSAIQSVYDLFMASLSKPEEVAPQHWSEASASALDSEKSHFIAEYIARNCRHCSKDLDEPQDPPDDSRRPPTGRTRTLRFLDDPQDGGSRTSPGHMRALQLRSPSIVGGGIRSREQSRDYSAAQAGRLSLSRDMSMLRDLSARDTPLSARSEPDQSRRQSRDRPLSARSEPSRSHSPLAVSQSSRSIRAASIHDESPMPSGHVTSPGHVTAPNEMSPRRSFSLNLLRTPRDSCSHWPPEQDMWPSPTPSSESKPRGVHLHHQPHPHRAGSTPSLTSSMSLRTPMPPSTSRGAGLLPDQPTTTPTLGAHVHTHTPSRPRGRLPRSEPAPASPRFRIARASYFAPQVEYGLSDMDLLRRTLPLELQTLLATGRYDPLTSKLAPQSSKHAAAAQASPSAAAAPPVRDLWARRSSTVLSADALRRTTSESERRRDSCLPERVGARSESAFRRHVKRQRNVRAKGQPDTLVCAWIPRGNIQKSDELLENERLSALASVRGRRHSVDGRAVESRTTVSSHTHVMQRYSNVGRRMSRGSLA